MQPEPALRAEAPAPVAPIDPRRVAALMRRRALGDALRVRNAGVIYAFVGLLLVLSAINASKGNPFYLREVNAANILEQSSLIGILAIFSTVVLISGNFDLSIGSTAALAAYLTVDLVTAHGIVVAVGAALLAGCGVGILNGLLVQKLGVNSFIVTLGTLTAVRGLVLVLTNGESVAVTEEGAINSLTSLYYGTTKTPNLFLLAGAVLVLAVVWTVLRERRIGVPAAAAVRSPLALAQLAIALALFVAAALIDYSLTLNRSVLIMLVVAVLTWLVLRATVVGRRLYAVGGSAEAARLSGIRVDWYKIGAFVVMGIFAGLVGVLFAARLTTFDPTTLQGTEFTAITASVLGGTSLYGGSGSVLKAVVGALILFTLQNGFNVVNLGANWQGLIQGLVIIVAVAVYTVAARRRRDRPQPDAGAPPSGVPTQADAVPASDERPSGGARP